MQSDPNKIIGLTPTSNFRNPFQDKEDINQPYFSAVQVFNAVENEKYCYEHNDELGEFIVSKYSPTSKESQILVVQKSKDDKL